MLDKTIHVLENACCGLPALVYGDRPAAQKLAGQNLRLMDEGRVAPLVSDCSSCAAFLKKYATLFAESAPRHAAAAACAARVRDILEVLAPAAGLPPVE